MLRNVFLIVIALFSWPAFAQEVNHGDACSSSGAWQQKNSSLGSFFLICNGTTWAQNFNMLSGTTQPGTGERGIFIDSVGRTRLQGSGSSGYWNVLNVVNGTSALNAGVGPFITFATNTGGDMATIGAQWDNSSNDHGELVFSTRLSDVVRETMRLSKEGYLGIGDAEPSVALDVVGDIHYTGMIVDISDSRMKEKIKPLNGSLSNLRKLQGVSFVMKDDDRQRLELGFLAQDVSYVYPELTQRTKEGALTLNYVGLIAPLVEALKELDAENNALRLENERLSVSIHKLSARMDVIEGKVRPPLSPLN